MNFDILNSRNQLLKRNSNSIAKRNHPTNNFQNSNNQPMRIFDSNLFSGIQGLEVDNMAMMIRTFNR